MGLAERINALAAENKMNLHQVANKAGISYNTLYALVKRGSERVDVDTLQKIASALDESVEYLLGKEERRIVIPGRLKIYSVDEVGEENYRYRIDAADEEAFQIGLQIFKNAGVTVEESTPAARITIALGKLNDKGQCIAAERVEELTKISDYQQTSTTPTPPTEDKEKAPGTDPDAK